MKKNGFILVAAMCCLLMSSCGNGKNIEKQEKTNPAPALVAESDTAAIVQKFKELYTKVVASQYDSLEKDYTSQAYYSLFEKVQARAAKDEAGGYVGFFDYDHWMQAQDGTLTMPEIKSIAFDDSTHATVVTHFTYTDIGGDGKDVTFKYVRERGGWYIDDINGERKGMSDYVK